MISLFYLKLLRIPDIGKKSQYQRLTGRPQYVGVADSIFWLGIHSGFCLELGEETYCNKL
jgi:hypothetical protein